jgi:hypothetical protein
MTYLGERFTAMAAISRRDNAVCRLCRDRGYGWTEAVENPLLHILAHNLVL